MRGLKTAIIDKQDFAFGTSSRSSKLAHGGLRYLNQAEFKLVHEACLERNWMRQEGIPHLIRPEKFTMPGYKNGKTSPLKIRIALILYDLMSEVGTKYKNKGKRKFFSRKRTLQEEPNLNPMNLKMSGQYYDNNIDDARLTLEAIKESIAIGNTTAVNYIEVLSYVLEKGKIIGVNVKDNLNGEEFAIRSGAFVNATGIWTDELLQNFHRKLIRPTKGVHLMVPTEKVGNNNALVLNHVDDGRAYFVLKRGKYTLIGTTDTDYDENLDEPFCTKEDCDYLLRGVKHVFPKSNLIYSDIISTYAGIRPLVRQEGMDESKVSRKHTILDTEDGLTTIAGGKLTTWRKMGEDLLYHMIKTGKITKIIPKDKLKVNYSMKPFLISLKKEKWDEFVSKTEPDISEFTLNMLYQQYGKGAMKIVEMIQENPEMGISFLKDDYFLPAEIYYILKYEFAPRLIDVMCRRTEIAIKIHHTKQQIIAEKVADIMAEYYNWGESKKQEEIQHYLDYIAKTIWF
jgi:glycerol-3-phosphate dehydrogenase